MSIVLHLLCHEPDAGQKVEKDQTSASKPNNRGEMMADAGQNQSLQADLKRTKSMQIYFRTNSGPNFAPNSCRLEINAG